MPPLNSPARAKAVEARRAWEDVTELRDEKKRFEGFLAGEADTMRNRAGLQLEAVRTAKTLHVQFLAIAWRRALRWRVLGRIVAYSVRWIRRVLGVRSG